MAEFCAVCLRRHNGVGGCACPAGIVPASTPGTPTNGWSATDEVAISEPAVGR